jgi:hypothetical protein
MDAVFGDSEQPNLEAEVAAFAEKCYLKMRMRGMDKEGLQARLDQLLDGTAPAAL